jgi:hypothetical protein
LPPVRFVKGDQRGESAHMGFVAPGKKVGGEFGAVAAVTASQDMLPGR